MGTTASTNYHVETYDGSPVIIQKDELDFRIIVLNEGQHLYKSIINKFSKDSVFDYKLFEHATNLRCKIISWFALTYEKAEYYKKKSSHATVHIYTIKNPIHLLVANNFNDLHMYENYAQKKQAELMILTDISLSDISVNIRSRFWKYEYLHLNRYERAIYEFKFAFGFLYTSEQLRFIKLILKLQEYKLISPIGQMAGKHSIFLSSTVSLHAIRTYYNVIRHLPKYKKVVDGQRFSIYEIDKNITYNMCTILPETINGYVYINQASIWHPKMTDTSEITLFDPEKFIY